MIKIAPSILASDFGALREDVLAIEKAGAEWAHIDIMDGHFVPNLSMGPDIVKSIREASGLFFDCHLMVENPRMFVEPFVKAGAELITFHQECVEDMDELIDYIHSFGVKAAVAIKPATSEETIFPVLHKLDMVLVMSVVPGFGGQKFMPEVLDKVKNIRAHKDGKNIDIQMDGGINAETAGLAAKAGVNVFVAGSAVFAKPPYVETIAQIRKNAEENYNG
ncbi:MAG: ribulose-phosphate 3-epimerase [Clostridia bacterium]|nr:ribulose-phosphate 3-epimerase [Clostridia bacterium]